jgi:Concanavalin A-like lectin/glucanases superfamily
MKLIVIVLGLLVVSLSYILFRYFTNTAVVLVSTSSLKAKNPPIPVKNITSSSRYALGIWVYVNSWDSNNEKTIYTLPGKIVLYLDQMKPSLKMNFFMNGNNGIAKTVTVTNNFPLQKWVYVTVSVDNSFVDLYLDGKLIKSIKLEGIQSNATEENIYLGGNPVTPSDIVVSKFYKWSNPLSLSDVWNEYLTGNGSTSAFYKVMTRYGVNINLMKNNVSTGTYKLF